MSLAGRMFNVFADPSEVFHDVKSSPPCVANWLVPALLLIAVSWLGTWLIFTQDVIKHQLSEITEQSLQAATKSMPEAQAEKAREMAAISTKVSMVVWPPLVAFFSPFWGGLILWLGAKVLKGPCAYMKAVEVVGLANMIYILEGVLRSLLIVGMGNLFAAPSLMLVVKGFDPQNTVHGLLNAANIMTFWLLAVRSVGLARLSGASFAKAGAWVFALWLFLTGLGVGFGLAMKAIFKH
jgi:hypothetical protein